MVEIQTSRSVTLVYENGKLTHSLRNARRESVQIGKAPAPEKAPEKAAEKTEDKK